MDADLQSIQEARDAVHRAAKAQKLYKTATQEQVDIVVAAMVDAGAAAAERLGRMAHEETGFGRPESKTQKNLFATRTLAERMQGMRTAGVINKTDNGRIWEVATPMGVVAALVPSTNPTATAMYKAILAAKARCGIVLSPHPRAAQCTQEAMRVVAEAAYGAGAPEGLFGCIETVTLAGTDALLEHPETDLILATGGGPMVRAAYSKGKPAYGVGSGNVPVYVDRSANIEKAAADMLTGTSFDWGTLCSTERSVVADSPIRAKLIEAFASRGGHICTPEQTAKLRAIIKPGGRFNTEIVGQSPMRIAEMAGFTVKNDTRALIAEVTEVGPSEPLSMETLSPILSFYHADGWEKGCERCIEILEFGGLGHTLALHAGTERVIEQFALRKPSMRIVVNTVAALGSVGMTTNLFPAMTLGPGAIGGSITSDNISPLHLVNIKRVAFEATPLNDASGQALAQSAPKQSASTPSAPAESGSSPRASGHSWIDEIEDRLRARAGSPATYVREVAPAPAAPAPAAPALAAPAPSSKDGGLLLPDDRVQALIAKYRR